MELCGSGYEVSTKGVDFVVVECKRSMVRHTPLIVTCQLVLWRDGYSP